MLVFLDIDGVMVPAQGWRRPEILADGFPAFSNKAVYILQSVLSDKTNVILTTSHRSRFTIDGWKRILKNRRISVEVLNTLPQSPESFSRKDEIMQWFSVNGISEPFLILDDDRSLNDLPEHLKVNLVQPNSHIGLTELDLPVIKAIIDRGLQRA